jgi:hypothetical protein
VTLCAEGSRDRDTASSRPPERAATVYWRPRRQKVRCLHAWQAISGVRCGCTEGAAKVTWPPTFNEQPGREACAPAVEVTSFTTSGRAECEVETPTDLHTGSSRDGRRLPQVGDQQRHVLQMEGQVRRPRGIACAPVCRRTSSPSVSASRVRGCATGNRDARSPMEPYAPISSSSTASAKPLSGR